MYAGRVSSPGAAQSLSDSGWRRLEVVLLAGSAVAFLAISVPGGAVGDVPVYESGIRRLLHGERPWADFVYEYPPLSLALGLLPALAPEGAGFRYAFATEMLLAHLVLG